MAIIPKTQKKLRETQFFMGKLKEAQTTILDKEDFEFYLSAFLSAGRSVRDVLESENRSYKAWYAAWESKLLPEEAQLFDFMRKQRNLEVHDLGAKTQESAEMIPLAHAPGSSPLYTAHVDEGAEIGQKVYYLQINGKIERALEVCRSYLDLLRKLVDDFDHAFPT